MGASLVVWPGVWLKSVQWDGVRDRGQHGRRWIRVDEMDDKHVLGLAGPFTCVLCSPFQGLEATINWCAWALLSALCEMVCMHLDAVDCPSACAQRPHTSTWSGSATSVRVQPLPLYPVLDLTFCLLVSEQRHVMQKFLTFLSPFSERPKLRLGRRKGGET